MTNTHYPIADVVPHGAPMILIDQLEQYDEDSVTTSVLIRSDSMFCDGERIPAWIGIEYMAQTIAAYSGAHARDNGQQVVIGFLVGTRKYHCEVENFLVGERLTVYAHKLIMGDNGLRVFECTISRNNTVIAEANLNVFQPNNPENFLMEGSI